MEDRLLIDCVGHACLSLNENTGSGLCRFRGKFQEAEEQNKNKRVYPRPVLEAAVGRLLETIDNRGLYGELDHPSDSIIHLANTSHLITKLWWEGNVLMGEGEILPTPAGKVLRGLIDNGGRIGISSRGIGNGQVNNEGVLVIGESFKLITFDAVADPSCYAAFQQKIASPRREAYEYKPEYQPAAKKLNPNAFVSFFGETLQAKLNEAKRRI